MSTPAQQTSPRPSAAALASARQRRDRDGSRAGSPSGRSAEHAFLRFQSSVGNRTATAAVQRVRSGTMERAPESPASSRPGTPDSFVTAVSGSSDSFVTAESAGSGSSDSFVTAREPEPEAEAVAAARSADDLVKRAAELLDRFKKNLDPADNPAKGAQAPTSAGLGQAAAVSGDGALKHDAAAAGTSAGTWNLLTEVTGVVVNAYDSLKNMKDARKKRSGAGHHTASRKAKVKGADAVVGTASSGGYGAAVAKESTKLNGVSDAATAATAAEVSGIFSAVTGLWKGARAAGKVGGATRKYRRIKQLGDPGAVHADLLDRLRDESDQAEQRVDAAFARLNAIREAGQGRPPREWYPAAEAAFDAMREEYERAATATAAYRRAAQDMEDLSGTQKYAKKKQLTKIGKETVGGVVGEPAKAAGGIVAAVTAAGVLGSNPGGWIAAAVGAGLILGVAGYKAGRAATKRYEEVRHPERWAPEGEEPAAGASRGDSLKHALKIWKKVSKGERQAMARRIYRLAAGPDIQGSTGTTPEIRQSARELLVALKAGPAQHKLEPDAWAASLNDPEKSAGWIKEIAEQLASG
ncbi:hypothetical protein EV562_102134 [Streptomyces sp. BK208]|uniref:hypothetical protein n=1 Tax=Streptomyces sp. BK208 TaxID=2512150 RepID=UPI0010D7C350|nr:hypothetical protein [Streptomyces sp. BK208]TDT40750.1 hypothetical protein EV562_102134 [Streptomyces sp. BK208]